ncbi:MAG: cyclase family protein [Acidimicrobiia bacterium]
MRQVADEPVSAWAPPSYTVDERGKVVGVEPGTPNNWGRWGDDDQRGTANLLTPERVAAAAALVHSGKRFPLGVPITAGMPRPGGRPLPIHTWASAAGDGVLNAGRLNGSDDWIVMALQGTTQLDGLGHVGFEDAMYNGWWAGLITASGGARRLGLHNVADGLCGRGVLLDVARHLGVDHLERGFEITPAMLDDTAAAHGVEVRAGDLLFVRTGYYADFLSDQRSPGEPGLDDGCIEWLHEHDVAFVGADNQGVQFVSAPPGRTSFHFHIATLRDLGLYLGEILDLDALADDCADDGVYEGFCVTSTVPVVKSVGSPINPIFVK